jgi:hypothetical protein
MGMITVDVTNTFASMFLLGSGPRMKFQTQQEKDAGVAPEQDTTKDRQLKWELQLAVTYHTQPGARIQSEVLSVTMTGASDPAAAIPPGPVETEGLRCGLSAPEAGDGGRIRGGKLWWQADKIRAFGNITNGYKAKSEVAV